MDLLENLNKAIEKTLDYRNDENLNISQMIKQDKNNLSDLEIELAQKLNAIEEYVIDRFEGNIAVLENSKTREIKNVERNKLPEKATEGSILKMINEKYFLDQEKTDRRQNEMQERMNKLMNKRYKE